MNSEFFSQITEYILYTSPIWALILYFIFTRIPKVVDHATKSYFDQYMTKNLERFKDSLVKDLELLKIIKGQVEAQKVDAFIKITDTYGDFITGRKPNIDLKKFSYEVGTKLFLFSSDETIKKYLTMRDYIFSTKVNEKDDKKVTILFAEFIVQMRKDLGYSDTKCDSNDFVKTIIKQ